MLIAQHFGKLKELWDNLETMNDDWLWNDWFISPRMIAQKSKHKC